jgi:hypothetical protein
MACLVDFDFGLLLLVDEEVPAARAVAAAAAAAVEDFEAEREDECFWTPAALETELLRRGAGFAPGGNGLFLGGAIAAYM